MENANKFREKIHRGEVSLGTTITFVDSTVTEALCSLLDFVWIDMEHNALSLETVQAHLMATKGSNTTSLVRVPWNDPVLIKPVLDIGADGVIVPLWHRAAALKLVGSVYAGAEHLATVAALADCALMVMLTRKFSATQTTFNAGEHYQPMGIELAGLKLGIMGFGASELELARRALPFRRKISAIDNRDIGSEEARNFDLQFAGKPADIDSVIAEAEDVSLLSLPKRTTSLIGVVST